MQLTGLSVAQLLSLLGAASALTIALYLLRQRRRRVVVPFLPLWDQLLRDQQSVRLFHNLKRLLSLLLALLIVSLLVFAIGDPRPKLDTPSQSHALVLVDAGASMQARDVAPSRFQSAVEQARQELRSAGSARRMLLGQMDATTVPLSPLSADSKVLERALEELTPTPLTSDPERAFAFALDVLRGQANPEIIMITDREIEPDADTARALHEAGIGLRVLPVGTRDAADNLAVTAFAARRYPLDRNRSELFLELRNASDEAKRAELTLLGDGKPIDVQALTLAPRSSTRKLYDDITGVDRELQAVLRVEGGDVLALDNRAYAVMPARRRVRVLCVTEGNRYLEAALLLDEYFTVDVQSPSTFRDAEGYDAVIFDRYVPSEPARVPALYLRPEPRPSAATVLEVEGEVERPFADRLQGKHPLLRFTALRDVNIASALDLKLQPGDVAVVADDRTPLIVAGQRAGQPFVALGFDLRDSDLPLRVAWPMLLLNVIDHFIEAERDYLSSHEVGRPVELPPSPKGGGAVLVEPDGTRHALPRTGEATVWTPRQLGFHRLEQDDQQTLLAVNLPADARVDLRAPADAAPRRSPRVTVEPASDHIPPWTLLLFAALALLSIEWITYHRRWTV